MTEQIHDLSARRQACWRHGADAGEVAGLTRRLADSYAQRRSQRARDAHGDPATIVKRARIESEIERLMSE